MFKFSCNIRVRYGETDQMGYVYYGNYAQYYEVARVEMLRSLGTSYKDMENNGVMMPVLDLYCKYIKPGRYDENLTITVMIKEKPGIRIKFYYEIHNEQQELINIGETILVFVNIEKNKPCLPPEEFNKKMAPYFT
ncbi:acyl-CoA thioesterase [Albibacterium bauzanense]|jgi:acyl-CoA thioester hydrolase|uniref:Acyl-CoA thioester hydrolase n=1 Tax=Albibacterium bauzanense TaxID=653929 RepID=A0A4R1M187_9SPHI|nr:thioesterase family protein [Albibacterium bauzanense]TCK84972.1 acyl-CoA thioester hydrolase [Albibacterium bauzanense]